MEPVEVPTSLKVVAAVFIIGGVLAVIEVLAALFQGGIKVDTGVLGLFVGPGLLALRPGWRTCALVLLWISMILMPIFTLLMLTNDGPVDFKLFGQRVGQIPVGLAFVYGMALVALAVWQYRTLIRPDIRALFVVDNGN